MMGNDGHQVQHPASKQQIDRSSKVLNFFLNAGKYKVRFLQSFCDLKLICHVSILIGTLT